MLKLVRFSVRIGWKLLKKGTCLISDVNILPNACEQCVSDTSPARSLFDLYQCAQFYIFDPIHVDNSYFGSDHYLLRVKLDFGQLLKSSDEHEDSYEHFR